MKRCEKTLAPFQPAERLIEERVRPQPNDGVVRLAHFQLLSLDTRKALFKLLRMHHSGRREWAQVVCARLARKQRAPPSFPTSV